MAEQNFDVNFNGYWRYINRGGTPEKPGVYCVYTSTYNEAEKTVSLRKLLYIGESENVNERLQNHEKESDWKRQLTTGEILSFSVSEVSSIARYRIEAALIFKHKPHVNTEYVNSFPFDKTTINTSGQNTLLNSSFTVYKTE